MTDANGVPRSLPLSAIDVEEGFNPRTTFDEEQQAQLVESVRRHGILQPLLVAPADEGEGFRVVAGHRRLAAAAAVGLIEVPAIVREPDGGEAEALAVIENLQREDLNPIDEARGLEAAMRARGLTQGQLAEELSISPKRVSERVGLLRLPEDVQRHVSAGEVPPTLRKTLAGIAKVSPQVASACAAVVAGGHVDVSDFERDPARTVATLGRFEWRGDDGEPEPAPVVLPIEQWRPVRLDDLPVAQEVREELGPRIEALGTNQWGESVSLRFDDEDADAARAYGCLLEFRDGDRFHRQKFVCDRDFIADRARLKLDELEQRAAEAQERAAGEHRERAARARAEAAAAGVEVDEGIDPETALREQRKREREAEREEASAARGANLELGRKLYTDAHAPDLTMDHARLLALLVFEGDAGPMAARGLGLCREDWQEVEVKELKSGEQREKVTYPSPTEAETLLWTWLERARTPQEVLGRLVQALVAAGCADESCRPQSQRTRYVLPGTYGGGAVAEIGALVDRLAEPYLPLRLAEQARERAQWRAEYAADVAGDELDESDVEDEEPHTD